MNILITGVGGPAGICFGKSLSQIKKINLVGANAEKEAIVCMSASELDNKR